MPNSNSKNLKKIPSFKTLVKSLLKTSGKVDRSLENFKQDAIVIQEYYEPRAEFERWRDSQDGKTWKINQYQYQQGRCAICKKSIPCKGSHIDHIKPISRYPSLNLDINNLQITCPDCNTSKSDHC